MTIIERLSNMTATSFILERWNTGKIIIGDYATGERENYGVPTNEELAAIAAFTDRADVIERNFSDGVGHATAEAWAERRERLYHSSAK